MGKSKEQQKTKSSQPRKSKAKRQRYRDKMLTIFRVKGPEALRLGRKLRKAAQAGRMS